MDLRRVSHIYTELTLIVNLYVNNLYYIGIKLLKYLCGDNFSNHLPVASIYTVFNLIAVPSSLSKTKGTELKPQASSWAGE